jgi:predicted nucleic acid-binding protein
VIRVVVDPGVFISALIGRRGGALDLVVRAFVDDRIEVVASPLLLAELEHATIVADAADQPVVTRDREDDYLVALGRQENVDAIVSGDLLDAGLEGAGVDSPRAGGPARRRLRRERRRGLTPASPPCGLRGSSRSARPRGLGRTRGTLDVADRDRAEARHQVAVEAGRIDLGGALADRDLYMIHPPPFGGLGQRLGAGVDPVVAALLRMLGEMLGFRARRGT